jgi:uncharacterized protein
VGLIYLDSCLVIYLAENHPRWGEAVATAMAREKDARFAISPLVKCECLVAPIRRGDPVLERAYVDLFKRFITLAMPEPVWLQAAQLHARFNLKTPDALHLASAQTNACESLWTNDARLAQAARGLARDILGQP